MTTKLKASSMPPTTKAAFYAGMAINQLRAACVLATSQNPRIQSTIWLQNLFFALELSVKSRLIFVGKVRTEKELKHVIKHEFLEHLKENSAYTKASDSNSEVLRIFELLYQKYINQKLRYLSIDLALKGISVPDSEKFLNFAGEIIQENTKDCVIPGISALLDH